MSFRRNFRHRLYWILSFWQLRCSQRPIFRRRRFRFKVGHNFLIDWNRHIFVFTNLTKTSSNRRVPWAIGSSRNMPIDAVFRQIRKTQQIPPVHCQWGAPHPGDGCWPPDGVRVIAPLNDCLSMTREICQGSTFVIHGVLCYVSNVWKNGNKIIWAGFMLIEVDATFLIDTQKYFTMSFLWAETQK